MPSIIIYTFRVNCQLNYFFCRNAIRSPGLTEKDMSFTAVISLISGNSKFFTQPTDGFLTEKVNLFDKLVTVMEFWFINNWHRAIYLAVLPALTGGIYSSPLNLR